MSTEHVKGETTPCASCEIADRLLDEVRPLGDVVGAALEALSAVDIRWGVAHLTPSTRVRMLRSLGLPAPSKPNDTFASHFSSVLNRESADAQSKVARHLTYPVIETLFDLIGDVEIDVDLDMRLLVDQLLVDVPQGMVRLAFVAHWTRIRPLSPHMLKSLLDDERLTLGPWASFAAQLVPVCESAIAEVADLNESADSASGAEDLDEFEEGAPTSAAELVGRARAANAAAAGFVSAVEIALGHGYAPPSVAMTAFFDSANAMDAAAEALGLVVPPPASIDRLEEALASLMAEETSESNGERQLRDALSRLSMAETTSTVVASLTPLCAEAAKLVTVDPWSDDERSRADILADLVVVVDAALCDDEERLAAYAERLSTEVDTKVIVAATRGRISLPVPAEAVVPVVPFSQEAGSTPLANDNKTDADHDIAVLPDVLAAAGPPDVSEDATTTSRDTAPSSKTAPPPVPPTPGRAVAVELEEDVEEDALDDLPDVAELLAQYIGERRFGIAAWVVQSSGGNPRFAEALRVAALADALRSPHGASVPELDERAASLSGHTLDGDRAGRLLVLMSALRVSLLHPQGALSGVIAELAERVGSVPGLPAVVAAVTRASQRGLSLTADLLPAAQSVASAEERVSLTVAAAVRELSQPRSTTFARGTRILTVWSGPNGLITRLLDPVRANDRSHRAHVEDEVRRLRDRREVEGEIDSIDRSLRGPGARGIEGQVRRALSGHVDRAVAVAAEWLDALAHLEAHSPDSGRWQEVPLRELRAAMKPKRERVLSSLSTLDENLILAAVGRASATMLSEVLDLLDGHPLPGPERSPFMALHDELLKSPDVLLGPDLEVPGDVPLAAIIDAGSRNWVEGFAARCAKEEFDAARAITGRVALDDAAVAAELERECADRLGDATSRVNADRRPLISAVNESRRSGFIDEDTWGALSVALTESDPAGRSDLGRCRLSLDTVSRSLAEARLQAQTTFYAEFEQKRAGVPAVAQQADVINRLADAGDLATARDVMARAESGDEPLTVTATGAHVAAFFPRVPEGLANGLSREDIERLDAQEAVAGVDLKALSPGESETALRGLRAWVDVKEHPTVRPTLAVLAPALLLLGIEADREGPVQLPGGTGRRWVDLVGVRRTGRALVPAFGSMSGNQLRMLCCWESPDTSTVLALVAQDSSDRPVIVLYFGTLSASQRHALASELRSRPTRPIIVVDDAAILYLAARGTRQFSSLMQLTLPFSSVNPYEPDVAGAVPTEMFYGRLSERRSVIEARGTSLIYGGRQLGKSALLHAAERRFEEVPGQVAVYVNLYGLAIAATKRPDAVWDPILEGLVTRRAVERRPTRKDPATATAEIVRAYLAVDPSRRILLLLDECDGFFDADAEVGFVNLSRLRELMDGTDRRFKVVFAGLHQVQRFAAIPNQPLAHLGLPQVIGPLAPQPAFDLLHGPLEALGFDIGDDLAARLMANANYQPLALQLYGRALIEVLRRQPFPGELPIKVRPSDVEAVLGDEALSQQVSQRFELTLRLDPRYRVIAYAVAYRAQESGHEHPISTEDLRIECQSWWTDGFVQLRPDEFRGLVEEMVGLGVLAAVPGGWRLRSPNVLRMLGTVQQIEDALVEAESETPPAGFAAAEARRVLDTATSLRSPLSESQLADLLAPGSNRVYVVLGSQACGIDTVARALNQAATSRVKIHSPHNRSSYKANLRAGEPGDHVVVLSVLDATSEAIGAAVDLALSTAPADGVTRSVALVVTSANLDWWPRALTFDNDRVATVELRRHSARSLWAWAVDVAGAFQDEGSRAELLDVTGGWPYLVDRAGALAAELAAQGGVRGEILSRLRVHLATPEGSEELVESVGLRSDEASSRLYEMILALGGAPETREDLAVLAGSDLDQPIAVVDALWALGVLVVDRDGRLRPEPVFHDAWVRSSETHRSLD